jgi:transposase-like protein
MSTSAAIIHANPVCPRCGCKDTAKKGKRKNRLQTLQIYRCTECLHRFTGEPGKNKTYPLRLILETVSTFNLGYSLTETQQLMRKRFHRQIPERTISSWLTEYRPHTTYARLRIAGTVEADDGCRTSTYQGKTLWLIPNEIGGFTP